MPTLVERANSIIADSFKTDRMKVEALYGLIVEAEGVEKKEVTDAPPSKPKRAKGR
jgi:hypothetical protein